MGDGMSTTFFFIPFRRKGTVGGKIESNTKKGATIKEDHCPEQILINAFNFPEKDGENRLVINLKELNKFIECTYFRMKDLFLVRNIPSPNDWMCKLDLRDAYFSILVHRNSQKNLRFEWEGSLYQFLCFCFGLSPMFTAVYESTESSNSLVKKAERKG